MNDGDRIDRGVKRGTEQREIGSKAKEKGDGVRRKLET